MPSQYDLPASFANASVEDVDKFNRLPFYLAMNEVKLFPRWNIWDQLIGTINWQPNMGPVMRGVTPQPSPVGEVFFYPQNLNVVPKKNIYETDESTEEARVKWHRYESKQFSFLPSFQDFRKNQLDYAHKDITRQVQVSNNMFCRTVIFNRSPHIYVAGAGASAGYQQVAWNDGSSLAKTSAVMQPLCALATDTLGLRTINLAGTILREDLQAPAFEGVQNMPKENELIKGKYVLIGSTEAWSQLIWDEALPSLKSINLDLVYQGLQGSLFGFITYKCDPFPVRLAVSNTGQVTYPEPQVIGSGNGLDRKVRPNPDYTTAEYELAFLVGADGYRSIKVGPPPSAFASRNIKSSKFYSLSWNGEVQITDQVLITTSSGGNITDVQLNSYGTQLKLQGQAYHGIIPGEPLNVLPILFRRKRVAHVV